MLVCYCLQRGVTSLLITYHVITYAGARCPAVSAGKRFEATPNSQNDYDYDARTDSKVYGRQKNRGQKSICGHKKGGQYSMSH